MSQIFKIPKLSLIFAIILKAKKRIAAPKIKPNTNKRRHMGIDNNNNFCSLLFNPGKIKEYIWNMANGIVTIKAKNIPRSTARSVSWKGEVVVMVTPSM